MPVHDWTKVSAGTFHDFHNAWIIHLKESLNDGLLPEGYYAQSEQTAGDVGPDVLTLSTPDNEGASEGDRGLSSNGATAVAEAPPKVSYTVTLNSEATFYVRKRRTLVIRHASGDRIVALIEIVSPGNKNKQSAFEAFVDKAISALEHGYHLLIIDLHPPGSHDPAGIHGVVSAELGEPDYEAPQDKPLTLASYSAGNLLTAYVEPIAVGSTLPDMPMFLDPEWYVNVPLESTYMAAWRGVPERWRRVIEGAAS